MLKIDRFARRAREHEDEPLLGKTKGQIESEIAEAIVAHSRNRTGRGPESIRATLLDDLLIIRQRGTLNPSEAKLASTSEGWDLVMQMRRKLAEMDRDELSERIARLTGRRVLAMLSDTGRSDDRVDVFILEPE